MSLFIFQYCQLNILTSLPTSQRSVLKAIVDPAFLTQMERTEKEKLYFSGALEDVLKGLLFFPHFNFNN